MNSKERIHLHVQPIPVILDAATLFWVKTGWSVLHFLWVALCGLPAFVIKEYKNVLDGFETLFRSH